MPESFKVLVKELQALALDVRVLDKNGEEIQLSSLCGDDELPPYSKTVDFDMSEDLEKGYETDDIKDSYIIEDAEGDDDLFGKEDELLLDEDSLGEDDGIDDENL